jgi:transcriptional regulator with XRE-family HTH domain
MIQKAFPAQGRKSSSAGLEGSRTFSRELGRRISRLRESKAWNRSELARKLGVSRDRLAKWEHGVNEPPLALLAPLAKLLGVTLDELITGEPNRTTEEQERRARRLEVISTWLR